VARPGGSDHVGLAPWRGLVQGRKSEEWCCRGLREVLVELVGAAEAVFASAEKANMRSRFP
jgi:hypothetical protein